MARSETDTYVADTYALIEILNGTASYKEIPRAKLVITGHVFVELSYYLAREQTNAGRIKAEALFAPFIVNPDDSVLHYAATLRFAHKKENLSYADCVGWAFAKTLGIPFLTGDRQFKGKSGVAFVR